MSVYTSDGNYHINKHKDARSAIYISGTFGSATVTLQYKTGDGQFYNFSDGVFTSGDQIPLEHGAGVKVYATITGSTPTTSIEITSAGLD